MTADLALKVPEELMASVPAEVRGSGRDDVRLLVSRGTEVSHHAFRELAGQLRAGDVLVVNTSATMPSAVDASVDGAPVVVHFSTAGPDGRWAVELRTPQPSGSTRRRTGTRAWTAVALPGGRRLCLEEPPYPERFEVTVSTAVRALESAAGVDGAVRPASGWTDLVVTPERGVRVVDGLLTGLHEPEASHLLMLEAIAGRAAIGAAYAEALNALYLWHEFGDVHLVLPDDNRHTPNCSCNGW